MCRMSLRITLILSLACGSLLPFAFAPFNYKALALIGLVGFLYLLLQQPKHPIKMGWIFGFGWFGFGGYWLADTIQTYGHLPYAVGLLVVAGLGILLASFMAFWAWSLTKLRCKPVHLLWFFPATGVLEEWLRSFVFTGLPWTAMGNLLVETPAASWLSVIGGYGCAFLLLFIVAGLTLLFEANTRKFGVTALTLAALLIVFAPTIAIPETPSQEVALIQPNVPQDQKWDAAFLQDIMFRMVLLSKQAGDVDLIIWPEAAVPMYLSKAPAWDMWLKENFSVWQTTVAFGGIKLTENGKSQSGLFLEAPEQIRSFVGKHHLVPFGEYVPSWLPWLSKIIPDIGDFEQASDNGLLVSGQQNIGAVICYESLFPDETRARVAAGADVLAVVTNDAWYGKSPAAWQHFQASQARAIETGRYVLRAANTGITAIISPNGNIQATMPWWEPGFVRGRYQPLTHITPYQQWGNYPLLGLIFLSMLGQFIFVVRGKA